MRSLVKDTLKHLKQASAEKPKMPCKTSKDSQAVCQLVSNQQLSEQIKHSAVVKHCSCWQFVHHAGKNPDGWLAVEKCSTDLMDANHLTKGLAKIKFDAN